MDPQAALYELLEAIEDGDREKALDHLDALHGWIKGGGFLPDVRDMEEGTYVVHKHGNE